jgi:hypothetical protein
MSRRLLLVMLMGLAPIALSSASRQTPQDAPPGRTVGSPVTGRQRVIVDGRTNPELIDHELLIAQIVGRMAIPASASPQDEQRLHLFAASIGFGKDDEKQLRTEMIRLHAAITPIQARLSGSTAGVPIDDLQAYREARLQSYGRLLEILSADGKSKLNDFIEKQKANTKVIMGTPRPASPQLKD